MPIFAIFSAMNEIQTNTTSSIARENSFNDMWNTIPKQLPHGLPEWTKELALLALFYLVALVLRYVLRYVLLQVRNQLLKPNAPSWLNIILDKNVLLCFARVLPPIVVQLGILSSQYFTEPIWSTTRNILVAYAVYRMLLVILALLDAILHQQINQKNASERQKLSLKSYIQLAKLVVIFGGIIIIIAEIINRSPLLLLSGLGAISAVLMLVFKDTILSFIAGVQLASTDMLRVGDWIEMDQAGANGYVTDLSLHFVCVQNWDKTITTIPTWRLVSESFRNWRGMEDTGARRMQFSIFIDAQSVQFIAKDELELMQETLFAKLKMEQLGKKLFSTSQSTPTNLGAYRLYINHYLNQHHELRSDLLIYVCVKEPSPTGIPIQVTAFADTTKINEYERIQGDVFDHVLAIATEFGLCLYQQPSGYDIRYLQAGASSHTTRQ